MDPGATENSLFGKGGRAMAINPNSPVQWPVDRGFPLQIYIEPTPKHPGVSFQTYLSVVN